jgi:hypothetical protein
MRMTRGGTVKAQGEGERFGDVLLIFIFPGYPSSDMENVEANTLL